MNSVVNEGEASGKQGKRDDFVHKDQIGFKRRKMISVAVWSIRDLGLRRYGA